MRKNSDREREKTEVKGGTGERRSERRIVGMWVRREQSKGGSEAVTDSGREKASESVRREGAEKKEILTGRNIERQITAFWREFFHILTFPPILSFSQAGSKSPRPSPETFEKSPTLHSPTPKLFPHSSLRRQDWGTGCLAERL